MAFGEVDRVIAVLEDDLTKTAKFDESVALPLRMFYGYKVLLFTNEAEFLNAIQQPEWNVGAVYIDHDLVYEDGRVTGGPLVVRKIRTSAAFPKDLPVIVASRFGDIKREKRSSDLGATAFLAKYEGSEGSESRFSPDDFADRVHQQLVTLGVWGHRQQDKLYPYYVFNDGWRFDRFARKLYDPSNVNVPLTPRSASVLERFLISPGQVLRPEDFGVDTDRSKNTFFSNIIDRCKKDIRKSLADDGKAVHAFQKFVEELRAGNKKQVSEDQAMDWLVRWIIADPVSSALIQDHSGRLPDPHGPVPTVDLDVVNNGLDVGMGHTKEKTVDTSSREEIIKQLWQLFRQSRYAQEVLDALGSEIIRQLIEPLDEFYASVRARVDRSGADKKGPIIDELFETFFRVVFPGLPESTAREESGFTVKNLRQRIIPDLRSALGDTGRSRPLITSVRNLGYRFEAAVEAHDSDNNRGRWAWRR